MSLISRDKVKTELGKILYDRLEKIWDDEDFLLGIFVSVRGDEKKMELLKYLDTGETDTDKIIAKSLDIAYGMKIDDGKF